MKKLREKKERKLSELDALDEEIRSTEELLAERQRQA